MKIPDFGSNKGKIICVPLFGLTTVRDCRLTYGKVLLELTQISGSLMMQQRSASMAAYMAPKQYGILATGFGSARDNVEPAVISKINRDEHKAVLRARRYGMEVSLKFAMRKQDQGQDSVNLISLYQDWN